MPLLDRFNWLLNRTYPWRRFPGAWAAAMAWLLNQGVLPAGYDAAPLVERDGPIAIDPSLMDRPDFSVLLAQEASYQMTCAELRIREAGWSVVG